MLRYFVAGNLWAFFGVLMVLGQGHARSAPTFYSFFGQGWLSPGVYSSALFLAFGLSGL